jgi:hypothetical protein
LQENNTDGRQKIGMYTFLDTNKEEKAYRLMCTDGTFSRSRNSCTIDNNVNRQNDKKGFTAHKNPVKYIPNTNGHSEMTCVTLFLVVTDS